MSDAPDKESKTEEPTEKKISDAVEKGNVPVSREASLFASIFGILVILAFLTQQRVIALTGQLGRLLDDPGGYSLEIGDDASLLLWAVTGEVGRFMLPIIVVLALTSIGASVLQNAPRLAPERIRPQWSRLSPLAGWKRIFGVQGAVEFLKALFKFVAIGVICVVMLRAEQYAVVNAMFSDPTQIPAVILSMSLRLVSAVCVATIVLVAADLVWARLRWRTDLRMSRQELKDEFKQIEGDPLVKARLRSLAKDRARQRMMTAVPRASLVIANPTHYAIALRYDRDEGGAPMVVAKGADLIALKIREIATKHGIPVIEDKALARAMYDAVEVDKWIPPEFYRAVAKILYFIYSRDGYDSAAR
jgi:flagellar biosynthetic protein FlhB